MYPRYLFLVEPFQKIVGTDTPEPDERRRSRGDEKGRKEDDEGEADASDGEEDCREYGEDQGDDDGEDDDGYRHDDEESHGDTGESEVGEDEGLGRISASIRGLYGSQNRELCGREHTAIIGFSVANLEILAMSSFRLSGGMILSSHSVPLLSMPVRLPCSPPATPEIISAMFATLKRDKRRILNQGGQL